MENSSGFIEPMRNMSRVEIRAVYQTVYAAGSVVVARTQLQVKRNFTRNMSALNLSVKSVILMVGGGPSGILMVTVTGERFSKNFVMEYRPERMSGYAIVTSLTQHISPGPATHLMVSVKTFLAAGDCHANSPADRTPTAGLQYTLEPTIIQGTSHLITGTSKIDTTTTAENTNIKKQYAVRGRRWYVPPFGMKTSRELSPQNTASINTSSNTAVKNRQIRNRLFNVVLFSLACWKVYKYLS